MNRGRKDEIKVIDLGCNSYLVVAQSISNCRESLPFIILVDEGYRRKLDRRCNLGEDIALYVEGLTINLTQNYQYEKITEFRSTGSY
ncbi:MAG: hypothetical protein Q7J65_03275 [Candidatus Marinimicrobia bacterium]|nr:hypothetical protein [Candidatus Neomarinimicrobiota bacterium]